MDVEIYNQSGVKMFQQYWDSQSFSANQTRTFRLDLVRADRHRQRHLYGGRCRLRSGWGSLLSWDGGAATITVR